jgi:peroxiredoxin
MRLGRRWAWLGAAALAVPLAVAAHDDSTTEAAKVETAKTEAQAAIDQPAPAFALAGLDGKTYSLADYKGKYVVLEWNNFGCPFVQKFYSSGKMQELQKQYTEKGVVWLTICSSAEGKQGYYDADAMKEVVTKQKLVSTAYLRDVDGKVGKSYGAKTTPHMFVIDPKGVLIYAGAIDDKPGPNPADIPTATNYVAATLTESMSGKALAVKSTEPYGCSVKYAN